MNILVSGGFGFAGQYLIYKLLQAGHHVYLLGRNKKQKTISSRFKQLVQDNAKVNPSFHVADSLFKHVTLLQGDISKPRLDLADHTYEQLIQNGIDEIYNMAAYLKYEDKYREALFATNVNGTMHLLKLAKQTNAKFIHSSTAFITDKNHPNFQPIKEEYCTATEFSNVYVESKCAAELLIQDYCTTHQIEFSIYRFPILVGDSETGYTNSIFGFYEYVAAFSFLKKKSIEDETVRIKALPEGELNLTPIDLVIEGLLNICRQPSSNGKIFNLTDDAPTSPNHIGNTIAKLLGLNVQIVNEFDKHKPLSKIEQLFSRLTQNNVHFASKAYVFDSTNTINILRYPVTKNWEVSTEYFKKLLNGYHCFIHQKDEQKHTPLSTSS